MKCRACKMQGRGLAPVGGEWSGVPLQNYPGHPHSGPLPEREGGRVGCRSPWRSRPAATGGSVQTHRDSDADAFGAVESALPADSKTKTGSAPQPRWPRDASTSVHGPAPPSRPACAGAGHSDPARAGRTEKPRPRLTISPPCSPACRQYSA